MEWDERLQARLRPKQLAWMKLYIETRAGDELLSWISTFHPGRLPCEYAHADPDDELRGSYNWNCQVIFTSGESWMVRFVRGEMVRWADEKVEHEVAAIRLIRQQTDIPVPEIKAWGLSKDCPLGLGPFIIMPFVKGISLDDVLGETETNRRLLGNVDDRVLDKLYRQLCRFQLALSQLDFPRIGGLSWDEETSTAIVNRRPFTWREHEILQCGGINVFSPRGTTYTSVTEHFDHITEGNITQLVEQHSSALDRDDAEWKYRYWHASRKIAASMVLPACDHGPFKLLCDDFTPGNMLVDNADDLNIVAVLDWEWSYAGPAQMFWSPPPWLILSRPTTWSKRDERLDKYTRCLDMYTAMLCEEERAFGWTDPAAPDAPSAMVKHARRTGLMWYNQIMQSSFNGPQDVPFLELATSSAELTALAEAVPAADVEQFVEMKMQQLAAYDAELDEITAAKEAEDARNAQLLKEFQEEEDAYNAQHDNGEQGQNAEQGQNVEQDAVAEGPGDQGKDLEDRVEALRI